MAGPKSGHDRFWVSDVIAAAARYGIEKERAEREIDHWMKKAS
jgi:hypothetical protein